MPKFCGWLLALVLASQGTASAQTITAAKPAPTPAPSISASTANTMTTATKNLSNTGEIFRWVDKNGKVQYSTTVPEDRRSTARKVDTRSNIVSSRVPASILSSAAQPAAQLASGSSGAAIARQPVTEREKCEAAWQRYNESVACFGQYRQGINAGKTGAAISTEAQAKCQNLAEPAACK